MVQPYPLKWGIWPDSSREGRFRQVRLQPGQMRPWRPRPPAVLGQGGRCRGHRPLQGPVRGRMCAAWAEVLPDGAV